MTALIVAIVVGITKPLPSVACLSEGGSRAYGTDFLIELDAGNGDLVNITMYLEDGHLVDSADYDGDALLALSNDAKNMAMSAGHLPLWAWR